MADGLRYLSLFSGVEAAWLAWKPLGWQCVAVAEIDPNACCVLAHCCGASRPKYMPDPSAPDLSQDERDARALAISKVAHLPEYGTPGTLPNLGDVSQATATDIAALGSIDVLIGGSPCQDLSVAGKRAGLSGARSGLFHQQVRIFDAARSFCGARWLVWENVPGAFSSNKGRDFAVVAGTLAGCELDVPRDGWGNEGVAVGDNGLVEWSVLDAQWFGVAQRRRRVFAVLDTGDWAGRPPVLLERDSLRGDSAPSRAPGEGVTGTLEARLGRSGVSADFASSGGLIPQFVMAHGQGGAEVVAGERSPTLTCNHEAPILVQEVVPIQNATRGDAQNGLGIGGEAMFTLDTASQHAIAFDTTQITSAANYSSPQPGDPCHPLSASAHPPAIAFDCKASGQAGFGIGEIASTMRSMGHADSHQNGGGHQAVMVGMQVRRLTPVECERLQGAPDNWTLVPNRKGKPMADGPRYKMLGNSFAVVVIQWIGKRVSAAHCHAEVPKGEAA